MKDLNKDSMKDDNLPSTNDVLFKKLNEDIRKNAALNSGIDKFFLYSDSYKIAAEKLFEQIDGSTFMANTLCYPLIFLCRHFIELRLKELIVNLNYAFNENHNFPNGHSLITLWIEYKKLIDQQESYKVEPIMLENIEKLVREFDAIDSQSFTFRYPVDKTPERNPSLKIGELDFDNFVNTMKKLFYFFDDENLKVSYFVDMAEEYRNIMYQQYISSHY